MTLQDSIALARPRPETLTPTLSQPPPALPGEGVLAILRQAVSLLSRRQGGGWERRAGVVRARVGGYFPCAMTGFTSTSPRRYDVTDTASSRTPTPTA